MVGCLGSICASQSHLTLATMEGVARLGVKTLLYLLISTNSAWGHLTVEYKWNQMECPEENVHMMVTQVPWGIPGRAYKTLPRGLIIAPSKIQGAGFGVISETFIPKYTWLGTTDGEIVRVQNMKNASTYTWMLHRGGKSTVLIDAFYFHLSSYHRYINAALRYKDENVITMECYGRIHHMTSKNILPGEELLMYYGHGYMTKQLGIDLNLYYDIPMKFLQTGLNLNNITHQYSIEKAGFKFQEVKNLSPLWLSVFLMTPTEGSLLGRFNSN